MWKRGLIRIILVVLGASALTGCRAGRPAQAAENSGPHITREGARLVLPEGSPLRRRLGIGRASTQHVRRQLHVPAGVEADPRRLARITPPLAGRVIKVLVQLGDAVEAGRPLFTMGSAELVAAQTDYLRAEGALAQVRRVLARQRDLAAHGIAARREVEQAETDTELAQRELDRARLRLRLLGMSPGECGRPLTVRAPIGGRVIELAVAPGEYRNDPAAVLLTLADLSTIWVTANAQEKDLRWIQVGDEARIGFAAYPGETFRGRVQFVGEVLDPETRTVKVRVSLSNQALRFKPGMFASVEFVGRPAAVVVVPTSALLLEGQRSQVFVQVAPWAFEARPLELGEQHGEVTVVQRGLAAGTAVVSKNAILLQ